MCCLFPGMLVKIDTVCPDCKESIVLEMRNGDVVSCEPEGVVVHDNVPSNQPWSDR